MFFVPYTFATCFGPLPVHLQACRYKNHLKEDTAKQNVRLHLFADAVLFKYEGDSKSKGKIHLTAVIQVTVSNFTYYFST